MPHYYYKIHQMHDSDILLLKIWIPDKNNLFATLVHFTIYTIQSLSRGNERLQLSTSNVLLGNQAFSNILNSVFVKLVSAILCGYAVAMDKHQVGCL